MQQFTPTHDLRSAGPLISFVAFVPFGTICAQVITVKTDSTMVNVLCLWQPERCANGNPTFAVLKHPMLCKMSFWVVAKCEIQWGWSLIGFSSLDHGGTEETNSQTTNSLQVSNFHVDLQSAKTGSYGVPTRSRNL